ncbi:helix-turn-helix transcriptional regulator [Actinomadura rudentiformis]|uniref:AAA family ATPase n=1 Tax=Actinomadura rudentiformis TaxID=359158 RepID=A0A6H9YNZ0_9ACTN|nr:LuxR family transcriptional regulator [Actinomadura rudentiformis]KAB2344365.1 AAA family ATPase [Actinomadura rudentiformis]
MEGPTGQPPGAEPSTVPLVGRQDALRVLEEALDSTAAGAFRFIALVGEPGAGKTRLLGEIIAAADARKLTTLSGRAAEFEQEMPFGAIVDALDDLLEEHRPNLTPTALQLLGTVFPALEEGTDAQVPHKGATSAPRVARYQLHRAIRHLLEEIASNSGLVLLLDDVHWSDEASIELLDYLVRHPPRARVLVAMAYRPAQVSPRLAALVDTAGEHGRRVSVDPLSAAEVAEFLGPHLSRSRCQALYEASGGNPFYLEALSRRDRTGSPVEGDEPGELWGAIPELRDLMELPPAVRSALQMELGALPEVALRVAQAAALAADEFEPALAAAGAELSESEALAAIDELVARDLVRPAVTGRFRFRHPLVRHVAYGSAAAGWRLGAHSRISAYLAELGAPATLRAHHVERSAGYGDRAAVATLVQAARTVAPQAPATAAHWLEAALRLLPEDPPADADSEAPDSRLRLLMDLVHVQTVSGQLAEGRETAKELLRLLPEDDHARRARAVQLCAVIERQLHHHQEARALVLDELQRMPDPQASSAVLLRVRLVADRLMRVDIRGAQAVLDHIPTDAPNWEPGLKEAVASLRVLPAYASLRTTDAITYAEEADRILSSAPDANLAECLDTLPWLCWTEVMMGRYSDALRHLDRIIEIARATGQASFITYMLTARARACLELGRLSEAAAAAEEATETARLLRSGEALVFGLTQQCLAASRAGDHDQALRLGEEAVRGDIGAGEWWGAMARYAHGVALVEAGHPKEGADALMDACGDPLAPMLDPATLLDCAELMARIEAEAQQQDEAHKWAEIAGALAQAELPASSAIATLARAHATRAENAAEAARLAADAAETLLLAGRRIDAGRAEVVAGLAQHAAGERDRARQRLRVAAGLFAECGAESLHAQTVREQRKLGVRVTARPGGRGEGPFGLSPREYEIAIFVAEGHTNQQIAKKLFLSVRTVETHLSRVFTKLGVTSRVGVATTLNRAAEQRRS